MDFEIVEYPLKSCPGHKIVFEILVLNPQLIILQI